MNTPTSRSTSPTAGAPFYGLVASSAAEEFGHIELEVAEETHPEGAPAYDLPAQPAVFAPGPEPGEVEEVAAKLRKAAGLPSQPTGTVAKK